MKNLYFLDETEKERILGIHKFATEGQYLIEKLTSTINSDIESSTKYWGVSSDGNVLFLNDSIIVVEENEMKRLEYGFESLHHLLGVTKREYTKKLNESKISWDNYISLPKKFLNEILNTLEISTTVKNNLLYEWDIKFFKDVNVLNEGLDDYLKYDIVDNLWNEVGVITERTWEEWYKEKQANIGRGLQKIKGTIGGALSSVSKNIIMPIIQKGIIPFIRWIRRNLQNYYGIIIEVVASFFPTVVVVKAVYILIVILDCYEILTGNFDPLQPERQQMPFVFLIMDVIALLFTGLAAKSMGPILKTGAKSPTTTNFLKSLIKKLPLLKSFFESVKAGLKKVFGETGFKVISFVFDSVDSIITKIINWIKKTFGVGMVVSSVKMTSQQLGKKWGIPKLVGSVFLGVGLAEFFKSNTIKKGDKGPNVKIIQEFLNYARESNPQGYNYQTLQTNSTYDDATINAVKIFQKVNKLPETGYLTPDLLALMGVNLGDDNITWVVKKIVGEKGLENITFKLQEINKFFEDYFNYLKNIKKN